MLKKIWNFIWKSNHPLSWVINLVLAFIIVYFVVYPLLGLLMGTSVPVVAVMSGSMEHDTDFDYWWGAHSEEYIKYNITKEMFSEYIFDNGFNQGDMIVIIGKDEYFVGDVIVFSGQLNYPLIHRVVSVNNSLYTTKGDHNTGIREDEINFSEDKILGKAVLRVPWLGWIKLGAMKLVGVV